MMPVLIYNSSCFLYTPVYTGAFCGAPFITLLKSFTTISVMVLF
jgi:hypothetical protein